MEEVKAAGGEAARTKRTTAWRLVMRFDDGIVVKTSCLFESEAEARKSALGMRDFCLNNGDLDRAEDYERAKFAVYPVEFDEPEIDWEVTR